MHRRRGRVGGAAGRLLDEMKPAADSIRFYFLDADVKIEHHGAKEPMDMDGPLVV